MTLILPHLPKTGGSSLKKSLEDSCGNRLHLDYKNNSKNLKNSKLFVKRITIFLNKKHLVNSYDVIYGHFNPTVYEWLNLPTGLFFRDPVRRVRSHFNYLINTDKIHKDTSLVEFAAQERMKNLYQFYLGSKTVDDLDYIGITERYNDSLLLLEKMFSIKCEENRERIGAYNNPDIYDELHSEKNNIEIYKKALIKFDRLCDKYL